MPAARDTSAALLFYGALGILAILLIETIMAAVVLPQNIVDAFYGASKTLVTVDPNQKVAEGPAWYKLFTSLTMILSAGTWLTR